jgi:alkylhydroperoxidase family enzyme
MTRLLEELQRVVLRGPGQLEPTIRQLAFEREACPPTVDGYVARVADAAYKVSDNDITALRGAGHTDDQIFELTVTSALGEAHRRVMPVLEWVRELDDAP